MHLYNFEVIKNILKMSISKHETILLYNPYLSEYIEVDKEISKLINLLWKLDIVTLNSCQEIRTGIMWIQFPFYYGEVFIHILCSELNHHEPLLKRILRESPDNAWEYNLSIRDHSAMDYNDKKSTFNKKPAVSFNLSVFFPKEDYSIVLKYFSNLSDKNSSIKEI